MRPVAKDLKQVALRRKRCRKGQFIWCYYQCHVNVNIRYDKQDDIKILYARGCAFELDQTLYD